MSSLRSSPPAWSLRRLFSGAEPMQPRKKSVVLEQSTTDKQVYRGCERCPLSHLAPCERARKPEYLPARQTRIEKRPNSAPQSAFHISLLLLLLLAILLSSCEQPPAINSKPADGPDLSTAHPVVQRGDRVLGIDLTMPEEQDYDRAMQLAHGAGAREVSLSVFWDDIEVSPGVYDPDPNWLAIANSYYPAHAVKISLMLGPIDTNQSRLPPDLAHLPFDDPLVIQRYAELLEFVLGEISDLKLSSIAVGNEVDIYLGTDAQRWRAYQSFYAATVRHIHAVQPGVPVGVKTTFEGMMDERRAFIQELNKPSDVVLATYYPLEPDFTVRPPDSVHQDFAQLTDAYPDRPIYLLEAGYPSSETNGSSEDLQAAFVQEIFKAWDTHADQIQLVSFTWLSDLPQSSVEELAGYYGLHNRGFAEFLRSLGLRTFPGSGTDKPAWQTLLTESERRGW